MLNCNTFEQFLNVFEFHIIFLFLHILNKKSNPQKEPLYHGLNTIFIMMREFHDFEKIQIWSTRLDLSLN